MEGGWIEGGENGSGEFGSVRLRRIGIKITWVQAHVIHLDLVSFYPPKTVNFNTLFRTTMQFNTLKIKCAWRMPLLEMLGAVSLKYRQSVAHLCTT